MRRLVLQHPMSEMYRSSMIRTASTSIPRTLCASFQEPGIQSPLNQSQSGRTTCTHCQYIPRFSAISPSHMTSHITIPWSIHTRQNSNRAEDKVKPSKGFKKDEPKTVAYVESKKRTPRKREKLEKRRIVDVRENMTLKQLAYAMNADKGM